MNGAQLQAACARRRDADEMKFQKTKEVDKYFNKWNKITTRYVLPLYMYMGNDLN